MLEFLLQIKLNLPLILEIVENWKINYKLKWRQGQLYFLWACMYYLQWRNRGNGIARVADWPTRQWRRRKLTLSGGQILPASDKYKRRRDVTTTALQTVKWNKWISKPRADEQWRAWLCCVCATESPDLSDANIHAKKKHNNNVSYLLLVFHLQKFNVRRTIRTLLTNVLKR